MENAILILVVDGAHSLIMQQNITGQWAKALPLLKIK